MLNYKIIIFILLIMVIFSGNVFADNFSKELEFEGAPSVVSVYTDKMHRTGVFITPTVLITDLDIVRSSYDITIENNRGYKSKVIGAKNYIPSHNLILLEANKSNDFYLDISDNYRFNLKEKIYLIKYSLNSETNIISENISNIINDNLILTNFSIKNNNNGSPVIKNNEIIGVLFSGNNIDSDYENYLLTYKILNKLVNFSKKTKTFSLEKVITGPYYKRANEFQYQTNTINMFIKEAYFLDDKLYTSVNINNAFLDRIITGFSNITQTIVNERNEIVAKEVFQNINLVIPPNKNKTLNLIYENDLRFKLDDLNMIKENYNVNPVYDKVLVGKLLNNNKVFVKDQLNLNAEYTYWNGDEIAVVINIANGHNFTINKINHLILDIYDKNGKINKLSFSNSGNINIQAKSSKTMIFRFPNKHIMRKNIKEIDFDSFYIDYDIDYN